MSIQFRRRARMPPGMQDLQSRMGDVPADLGPAPQASSLETRGFDTTGTRLSDPGVAQYAGAFSSPLLIPFQPLLLELFKAMYRKATFYAVPFTASSSAALQVRPQEDRTYLLIQNTSAAVIYVGIGYAPTTSSGIQLPASGVYEPFQIPQNEIYILGSGAAQTGVLIYANG